MHQYIREMPEHEFVLWVIGAKAEDRDKFVYTLPDNVSEVYQVFLDDALRVKDSGGFPHRFTDAENQALVNAAQVYCKYMIGKANKTTLQQYFDPSSDSYKTMTSVDKWMQSYKSYAFAPASITEYYRYSDTLYSARVEMTLNVTRKDDTVKEYPLHSTFILQQQDGQWKVINMLNLSIQQQKTSVLLNYYDASGKTLLLSEMVDADANSLTPPAVDVPEGKQLYWSNRVNMFPADENGKITFPDDYTLEPTDFYAVLQKKEA
jgi:hypothetical protein